MAQLTGNFTGCGINYAPELTGIAPYNVALCEFLRARGNDVEMVTTFAYYPAWRKRPEDRQRLRSWGEAGRNYVERFEQRRLLERFTAELAALAG